MPGNFFHYWDSNCDTNLPYHQKVKGHPSIISSTNLVDFWVPDAVYQDSVSGLFCVLPYMGIAAILFNGAEPFEQNVNILLAEGPMWNLVKIVRGFKEEDI